MNLLKTVDNLLNKVTMYRLVFYCLIVVLLFSLILSGFGLFLFSPFSIVFSTLFLVVVCWITNMIFSWAFKAPVNAESAFITALILSLIVTPVSTLHGVILLFWVGVLAMASKFILSINKKHIFNPAALAAVITALALGEGASWWVGTAGLAPLVAMSGLLIFRKLRLEDMAWSFFLVSIAVTLGFAIVKGEDLLGATSRLFLDSSMLFLGSVMLTEPLTMPPTKTLRTAYGALVGFLSLPQIHLSSFYLTPELALVLGNIFAYFVSPKFKLALNLVERTRLAPDILELKFKKPRKFVFLPGQYMEWTLPHSSPDSRGNRRYFTLASSPTENEIFLGVKFYQRPSSFKKNLEALDLQKTVLAGSLAGDFTLPKDKSKKLCLIAGGIGVTPFRSMVKYLLDKNETRDIKILYSNRREEDIVYKDIFDKASKELGIKTFYTLTDRESIRPSWEGERGRIDMEMVKREIPDFKERTFYISGPPAQIESIKKTLSSLGVSGQNIRTDYFSGLS